MKFLSVIFLTIVFGVGCSGEEDEATFVGADGSQLIVKGLDEPASSDPAGSRELSESLAEKTTTTLEQLYSTPNSESSASSATGKMEVEESGDSRILDVCPVNGEHSFIDSFGAPRSGDRTYEGTSIMSARGTPVVVPVSGSVEFTNTSGGNSFRIYGDSGYYYYGSHLDSFAEGFSNGDQANLNAGDLVGYIGNTGASAATSPLLHFEIREGRGELAIDPYPHLAEVCDGALDVKWRGQTN